MPNNDDDDDWNVKTTQLPYSVYEVTTDKEDINQSINHFEKCHLNY